MKLSRDELLKLKRALIHFGNSHAGIISDKGLEHWSNLLEKVKAEIKETQ